MYLVRYILFEPIKVEKYQVEIFDLYLGRYADSNKIYTLQNQHFVPYILPVHRVFEHDVVALIS